MITFEQAKAVYINRYTMEHVPAWAQHINPSNSKYYAPQYAPDLEWFERTAFFDPTKPECAQLATKKYCHSQYPTWPLGPWLDEPFTR